MSYVAPVKGGIGSYSARTTVTDAQHSWSLGHHGELIRIKGIGRVSVNCSRQTVASFRLTTWAEGEGPPHVTETLARTRGVVSLAGLAAPFTLPRAETANERLYQWEISDGGGEAFQFSAAITALVTPTSNRCDSLAEATVVTTGAFARYAP